MILDVPVDPGADEAREWIIRELSKPAYRAAEPTWFDRLATGFWEWLMGLLEGGAGGTPSILWAVVILLVLGGLVAAWFIFGPPRLNRRSTSAGALFGDDDSRDAGTIRLAAEGAAATGDWPLAIEEMFRCIARGLAERAVLTNTPGTTASGFAARAREFFPDLGDELAAAASVFDGVRYLDRPGSEAAYSRVAGLERDLGARKPRFETVPG